MRLFPVVGGGNKAAILMPPFDLTIAEPTRRVIKWYERIRPRFAWVMKGTPCQ